MPRLVMLLVLLLSSSAWATTAVPLDKTELRTVLGPYAGYVEDPKGQLSLNDVLALEDSAFSYSKRTHPNLGKNNSVWWFKVLLENSTKAPLAGYLEMNYPPLDQFDFYLLGPDGSLKHYQGGDRFVFSERPVQVSNFWFPTSIDPGISTLILRVDSTSTVFTPMYFSTYSASAEAQESWMWINGTFYGVLLAMFCYNLFLFLSLREKAYFWYLVYSFNVALLVACFDGLLFKLLPNEVALQSVSMYLLMYLHCLAAIQFSRNFLHMREYFPRLDQMLRSLMLVCALCLISSPLIGLNNWYALASITMLAVSAALLLSGWYAWRQGVRYGSYYTLAWTILLFAFIQATFGSLGIQTLGVYSSSAVKIGITVELIALSIGLADRINTLKEEGFRSRREAELAIYENQTKSRFLAKMSHEIRTPLNGVLGVLHLLKDTPLNAQQRFYLDIIGSSGSSLMTIINDILDFARIEAGKLKLESIEFDLEQMLSEAISLCSAQAQTKQLTLLTSLEAAVPRHIRSDPTRIKQVLLNLLGNAIKFTAQGHVSLSVSLRTDIDSQEHLLFAVTDTGIGISASAHNNLFESFAQADSSTTRRYGGSGLGLTISRELVEMLGGKIDVKSNPGVGSRFTFNIPLHRANTERDEITELLHSRRALIYSDDPQALSAMSSLLNRWAMTCSTNPPISHLRAETAADALVVLLEPWPNSLTNEIEATLSANQRLLSVTSAVLTTVSAGCSAPHVQLSPPLTPITLRQALNDLHQTTSNTREDSVDHWPKTRPDAPCVLVVEDNPVNQLVIRGLLNKAGYRVRVAPNGRAALAFYQQRPQAFDLILMDCEMPEMDGFEATRRIRRLETALKLKPIPIIALTAHIFHEHRQLGISAGMNDFMGKPIDHALLLSTLEQYLALRSPA